MAYYSYRTHVVILTLSIKLTAIRLAKVEPFPNIAVLPTISDVARFMDYDTSFIGYCNAPGAFSDPFVALAFSCDSPEAMEESPVLPASPPAPSISPVVQVRRYSWRSYAKHDAYGKRREFVGTNRQTNTNSSLFSPQKPLVSRVHLTNMIER